MKRLTINRIASAGLRTNKRSYVALAIGIFLSIFLVSALCLGVHGLYMAQEAKKDAAYGAQDALWFDCKLTDAQLMESGLFSEIGHVYMLARHGETSAYVGCYDASAHALMARSFIEGRMPEKPGEIALEESALGRMRLEDAGVGDTLTLTLEPMDGRVETRTFTIVGVLTEQSANLSPQLSDMSAESAFPAMLVHPDEPPFASGYTVMHAVFRLAPMVTQVQALQYYFRNNVALGLAIVNGEGYITPNPSSAMAVNSDFIANSLYAALLAGALLLATCVGIAGAMDGQLARRNDQTGMLRAVGATRRQIRRILGREVWLLALTVSPLGVLAGYLAAWVMSLLAPGMFVFRPSLWLVLPVLALSMVVVLLAGWLPLRRACRVMPMSVLRDTDMLRRMKRIRSRKQFAPSRLVAWRQLSFRPTRQLAPMLLMCLLFLVVSLTFSTVLSITGASQADMDEQPSFSLWSSETYTEGFHDAVPGLQLTEADIAQLRSLPGVKRVEVGGALYVTQELPGSVPEYWKPHYVDVKVSDEYWMENFNIGIGHQFLLPEEERPEVDSYGGMTEAAYDAARSVIGTDAHLANGIELRMAVIDPAELAPYVVSGEIDIEAINAGREVIVYAPSITAWQTDDGGLNVMNQPKEYVEQAMEDGRFGMEYTFLAGIENDAYTAGQTLVLHHLYTEDAIYIPEGADFSQCADMYAAMEHAAAAVTVGAVVNGGKELYNPVIMLTTEQGLKNMGFSMARVGNVDIFTGALTSEEEESLEGRIRTIAMRGSGYDVHNLLEAKRNSQRTDMFVLLLTGGMAVIFLSVCVAQISGSISRRIRSDARMVGMLRAVGADSRAIRRCYSGQAVISVLLGTALGLAVYWLGGLLIPGAHAGLGVWSAVLLVLQLTFAAMALAACTLILRLRVRDIVRRSIIDNIREL